MSTRRPSWRARCSAVGVALAALAPAVVAPACNKGPQGIPARAVEVESAQDANLSDRDLLRDLEATVLENYLQLTLGNMEAYADSVAEDREVTLLGLGVGDRVMGTNPPGRTRDRRPFAAYARPSCMPSSVEASDPTGRSARCVQLIAKRLDVHLHPGSSVGWITDEIDYRVPYQGREASVPLHHTAVLVRDIDRWVVVQEHWSYALPRDTLLSWARGGTLGRPEEMATRVDDADRGRAALLRRLTGLVHDADEATVARYAERMARRYRPVRGDGAGPDTPGEAGDPPATPRQPAEAGDGAAVGAGKPAPGEAGKPSPGQEPVTAGGAGEEPGEVHYTPESAFVRITPLAGHEYVGRAAHSAPSLVQLFGPGTEVVVTDYRLFVDTDRVAWMAANLEVTVPATGQARAVTIGMRGTYLFTFDSAGWNLVSSHISVPVTEGQMAAQVFGPRRPPPPMRPADETAQDPEVAQKPGAVR